MTAKEEIREFFNACIPPRTRRRFTDVAEKDFPEQWAKCTELKKKIEDFVTPSSENLHELNAAYVKESKKLIRLVSFRLMQMS